jgi:hypothetical protein
VNHEEEHEDEHLIRWLEAEARRTTMERPPPAVHHGLVALFDRVPDTLENALSVDWTAELLFDSRCDLVSPSTRGPATHELGYRLAFTSPLADVVLHVERGDRNKFTIRGQVMKHTHSDRFVVATEADTAAGSTSVPTDDFGRFALTDISPSVRTLCLSDDKTRVLLRLPCDADDQ